MTAVAGDLLLDPVTWDLALNNGDLVISSGSDAALQAQQQRLSFWLGEWFLDEGVGVPYLPLDEAQSTSTYILGVKNPNLPAIREIFRETLLSAPGTATVVSLDLSLGSDRTGSLAYVTTMDDGTELVTDQYQIGGAV